jgi:hypothetical protein
MAAWNNVDSFSLFVFRTIFSKHFETDELVHELTKNDFNLFKLGYKESLKSFQIRMRIKIKFASIVEASHRLRHEILYAGKS